MQTFQKQNNSNNLKNFISGFFLWYDNGLKNLFEATLCWSAIWSLLNSRPSSVARYYVKVFSTILLKFVNTPDKTRFMLLKIGVLGCSFPAVVHLTNESNTKLLGFSKILALFSRSATNSIFFFEIPVE